MEGSACNKQFPRGANGFTAGVYDIVCGHGVCYGACLAFVTSLQCHLTRVTTAAMHVIRLAEGPRDLVASVYGFCRTAPKYLVQDNACHSGMFALNHEYEVRV